MATLVPLYWTKFGENIYPLKGEVNSIKYILIHSLNFLFSLSENVHLVEIGNAFGRNHLLLYSSGPATANAIRST